MKDIVQGICSS